MPTNYFRHHTFRPILADTSDDDIEDTSDDNIEEFAGEAKGNVDPNFYDGIRSIFDNFIDVEMASIADDDEQLAQLVDASEDLFLELCSYLEIPVQ